ncbi:MAG: AI-2E family transporter [Peptostreptococcus sp.]|uniref:AI-2E family transporter n=1 Tax=Peptostreptococcus sp. TaxID=1262 RepID=UPI002FC6D058
MDKYIEYLREVVIDAGIGIKGYVKAQLKLMLVSFVVLSIGLYIIGIKLPILKAMGIAIVDVLPVVGSGIIMIPWAISFVIRDLNSMGANVIILYVILVVLRQIIEPKILGDSIGLRPLYTFVATILGGLIFGPLGVFLGPLIGIIMNSIYQIREREKLKRKFEENNKY